MTMPINIRTTKVLKHLLKDYGVHDFKFLRTVYEVRQIFLTIDKKEIAGLEHYWNTQVNRPVITNY